MIQLTHLFPIFTVGLDLGDRNCVFVALDAQGSVVDRGSVTTDAAALASALGRFAGGRVIMETGTNSPWISEVLTSIGFQVLVADARSVPVRQGKRRKSDRIDALYLARIGRSDPGLLTLVRHRPLNERAQMSLIRSRECLVNMRTKAVNCVRGLLKSYDGIRVPKCDTSCFARRAREALPEELREVLEPILEQIASMTAALKHLDKKVSVLADASEGARAVRQIASVGDLIALTYALTIHDPARFSRSRDVGAYIGLVPHRFQSGNSDPELRISKTGNRYLRSLLVNAAQYILGKRNKQDSDLRRFGLAMIGDSGSRVRKKKAVIAVARKLAVLMHAVWRSGEVYEPLRQANRNMEAAATAY